MDQSGSSIDDHRRSGTIEENDGKRGLLECLNLIEIALSRMTHEKDSRRSRR